MMAIKQPPPEVIRQLREKVDDLRAQIATYDADLQAVVEDPARMAERAKLLLALGVCIAYGDVIGLDLTVTTIEDSVFPYKPRTPIRWPFMWENRREYAEWHRKIDEKVKAQIELDGLRRKLRDPKIGLLASRQAYRRIAELHEIIDGPAAPKS